MRLSPVVSAACRSHGWMLAVALLLALVAWDAVIRSRHRLQLAASAGEVVAAAQVDGSSPTGYAQGVRALVLPRGATDTAHWLMQTQLMLAGGGWRLRHVDYDQPPTGREVHWAGPYRWWLGLVAWLDETMSGRPRGIAAERALLLAGPLMLALFMIGGGWWVAREFSPAAAVLLALGSVAVAAFQLDFLPARADHHGLANVAACLSVLLLAAGVARATGLRARGAERRDAGQAWLDGSAVAGGFGLWVSAATQVPVLIATGVGILLAQVVTSRGSKSTRPGPEPVAWRRWGLMGGGVSLLAYLVEYFPDHLGLRLEVNHPLYALAWAGGGEVLHQVARLRMPYPRPPGKARDAWPWVLALGALAALPVTHLLGGADRFAVRDPLVWRIHAQSIAEFQPLPRYLFGLGWSWARAELLWPLLLLVPPVWRLVERRINAPERVTLVVVVVPALLAWAMGVYQVRWLSLAFALTLPAVAVFFLTLRTPSAAARGLLAGCLVLAPGLLGAVQRTRASTDITTEEIQNLVERELAHWLRQRAGAGPVVVAAAPGATTKLIASGGLTGVGTLYWENADGLKQLAAFYAASSAEAAQELARRVGLTHIVFLSWDAFEVALAKLHRGLPEDAELPRNTFIAQLLGAPVPPPWLREVAFPLPDLPALAGTSIRVWEVTSPMNLPEAAVRATTHYLDTGQDERVQALVQLLMRFPDYLPAAVVRAAVAVRRGDQAQLDDAWPRVQAQLGQAGDLGLEDRVHLVGLLAMAQQHETAQAQLRAALAKVDEPALRRLPAGTLSDLLELSVAFGVTLPDPALQALAESLVPVARRR